MRDKCNWVQMDGYEVEYSDFSSSMLFLAQYKGV